MILPQSNYKNVNASEIPQEELNQLINDAYKYCKQLTNIFEFKGLCNATDLPSFHPYWTNEVKKQDLKRLQEIKAKYEECRANPALVKYHFNLTTSFLDIRKKIAEFEEKTKGVLIG